jgi:hypothetical protein
VHKQNHNHRQYQVSRLDTHPSPEGWELQRVVVRDGISFNFSPLVYTTEKEALEGVKDGCVLEVRSA